MNLGVHISGVEHVYDTLAKAESLGCTTMQIFARAPQRWRQDYLSPAEIQAFAKLKPSSGINPVFVHISYLINLASPESKLYHASIEAYIEDIVEASAMSADYIVTHMGSHKDTSEEAGIERLTAALNRIIEKTSGSKVGILLENTSGSGSWLGYKFEHHKRILAGLKDKRRIGICLDTAHAYSAGYDLSKKEGLDGLLSEIDRMVGLARLKLVHLNDAKSKLGSHIDRHGHIGKGAIGLEGMRRIINHPKLKDVPFILETPKDDEKSDPMNLRMVRRLRRD